MKKVCMLILLSIVFVDVVKGQVPTVQHFTVNNLVYVIEYDGNVTMHGWDYEKSGVVPEGHISIPANVTYRGKKYLVENIGDNAFKGCEGITSVTIPTTVVFIGNYAFAGCTKLESIKIPDSVCEIGENAFYCCFSLKSIELSKAIRFIEDYTFAGCKFDSITIPNSVVGISAGAFLECKELSVINLSNNLQYIGSSAFCDCKQLKSLSLPESVSLIGHNVFENCEQLKEIFSLKENKKIAVESVDEYYQKIDYYDASGDVMLKRIGDSNDLQVCGIEGDPVFCYIPSKLVVDTDENIQELTITSISDDALVNCRTLKKMYIPENIKFVGNNVFSSCRKLKKIFVPNGYINHFKKILPTQIHSKLEETDFSSVDYYEIYEHEQKVEIDSNAVERYTDFDDEPSEEDLLIAEINEDKNSFDEIIISEPDEDEDMVYTLCQQYPEYKGGNEALKKFLKRNIKYPKDAKASGIEGRVIVQFVVQKDGSVDDVVVVRSLWPSLDSEAVRVASKLRFIPGKKDKGVAVKVQFSLPVFFSLR